MSYDSNKRWVSTELDEDAHRALCRLATQMGTHPSKLIEQFVVDGLAATAEQEEFVASIDLQVFAGVYEVRRRARIRSQLVQIAFEHQQNPTEETADLLKSLCELASIPVEEIVRESEDATLVPLAQDNGTGVNSAMRWLRQVVEAGNEYPVVFIMQLAKEVGFSESIVKSAKQNLGIISKRRSKGWMWMVPGTPGDDVTTLN